VARGLLRKIAVAEVNYEVLFVAVSRRSPAPPRVAQAFLECLARAHGDTAVIAAPASQQR
jgi:hypothetical protein